MTLLREQFGRWQPLSAQAALVMVEEDLAEMRGEARGAMLGGIALLAYRAGDLKRAAH